MRSGTERKRPNEMGIPVEAVGAGIRAPFTIGKMPYGETDAVTKVPTAEELEALFREGKMARIGDGSRRVCYALPGGKLCVKSYRSEDELDSRMRTDGSIERHPLKQSVIDEIRKSRFDEKRNTSCREYRYWMELKERIPSGLLAAFPKTMEMVCVPSRGWCLVEELIENFDGTPIEKFFPAWRDACEDGRKQLSAALDDFEDFLVRHCVRFFDPQTIMVQRIHEGLRLRIPDFEPVTRTLIPFDAIFPALVRRKIRRRFARYRKTWGIT